MTIPEFVTTGCRDQREHTGEEEAHRPPGVRHPPGREVTGATARSDEHREGADVEEECADELDGGRPPVRELSGRRISPGRPAATQRELDEAGDGEEYRPGEEGGGVPDRADGIGIDRNRTDCEEDGADREPPRFTAQPQRDRFRPGAGGRRRRQW
jgi:hypothetical protein